MVATHKHQNGRAEMRTFVFVVFWWIVENPERYVENPEKNHGTRTPLSLLHSKCPLLEVVVLVDSIRSWKI